MKTVKIEKKVAIKDSNGRVRTIVTVELNGEVDELSGETFIPATELMKIDKAKVKAANIMLPEEIKALRLRYEKTQEEMCAIMGLGNRTWTRWESGAIVPNASTCRTLFLLRDGKISLEDLCQQRSRCEDWFGKPGVRCSHCSGIATQFAAMRKYDKALQRKGDGHAPTEVEFAA